MKRIRFLRLQLLSEREKAGRIVDLDHDQMAILGENDTGKSSLIKSIYSAFGADPAKSHPDWRGAEVSVLVDFSVDGAVYRMLRAFGMYAIFDGMGNRVWSGSNVGTGLAPELSRLLGVELLMQSREGELVIPPPAYLFAPFYVDQDAGWLSNWASFARMGQFEKFKESLAKYHAGMRPNEFYAAQARKLQADRAAADLRREGVALTRASERIRANRTGIEIGFSPDSFGDKIQQLLEELQRIKGYQVELQETLSAGYSRRVEVVEQLNIGRRALAELDADFAYLRDKVGHEVFCPTCGTAHHNDFAKKFELLSDVEICRSAVMNLQNQLRGIEGEIDRDRASLRAFEKEADNIEQLLNSKEGDLTLRDVLTGESERLVDIAFEQEQSSLDQLLGTQDRLSKDAAEEMKLYTDRKRDGLIKAYFSAKLRAFVSKLRVPNLPDSFFAALYGNPPETGSDQPRALLAYYYAFVHTIAEFSSAIVAPLVIDSPVQQDQDPENAKRIIDFALNSAPDGAQIILGSVRLHGVSFAGNVVTLTDKYHLLETASYDEVKANFEPLLNSLVG